MSAFRCAASKIPPCVLPLALKPRAKVRPYSARAGPGSDSGVQVQDTTAIAPFVFIQSNGESRTATTVRQFLTGLQAGDTDALEGHIERHDFSNWIGPNLKNPKLAQSEQDVEQSADASEWKRDPITALIVTAYGLWSTQPLAPNPVIASL
ncbi:hypothetical protein KNN17_11300 [Arthrobacter bambusae]|uniref:hypothetical protein n=1 Tax=Arthrobacter bambusae TaxID=1338426 RepID=UPI001F5140C1|nr:hypothetical protein [Arthrobacter bambusae]MCI0142165.1 hypothetical protein [Arthrobacter bambusae]